MNDNDARPKVEQSWKQLYEAALLELDTNLLSQRIADAEKAISERLVLVQTNGHNNSEKEALGNAHMILNDLKRIYQADARAL